MAKITVPRPGSNETAPYHAAYVAMVPDGDIFAHLKAQVARTTRMLARVNERRSRFRYAPGKWTIREVLGHMIDAERVFTYRATSFARGDRNPLPGFDENSWAATSNADNRPMKSLVEEFRAVRASSLALFKGFGPNELVRLGFASGHQVSVRGLIWVTAGHELHHARILKNRYLSA